MAWWIYWTSSIFRRKPTCIFILIHIDLLNYKFFVKRKKMLQWYHFLQHLGYFFILQCRISPFSLISAFMLFWGVVEWGGGVRLTIKWCYVSPSSNGKFSRKKLSFYNMDLIHVVKLTSSWLVNGDLILWFR